MTVLEDGISEMESVNVLPLLPDEILSIICETLGQDRDYDSLYQCARSSKSLADPALRTLYRYHEFSPAFLQSDEDTVKQTNASVVQKFALAERAFVKWTRLWHSVIASSLDQMKTYKPYCRYLRILDFRNLALMLEDPKFANNIRKEFFKNGLARFYFPIVEGKRQRQVIHVKNTIDAVGDAVAPKTSLLEEISGDLSPGLLTQWVACAPKLRNIVLYRGDALARGTGSTIAARCESFRTLTIHEWRAPTADLQCAIFLDELNRDSLQYFEIISFHDLGPSTFGALGKHRSLQDLRLGSLSEMAVGNLNALKECTELHTLVLENSPRMANIEHVNGELFQEVVDWLSSCTKLRDLTLKRFLDGPTLLAQVLIAPDFSLTRLSVEGYVLGRQSSPAFHTALSEQQNLESLCLKGNGEDASSADLLIMIEALSNLKKLRELELKDISDEFEEQHIIQLVYHLKNLEVFWTSGQEISATVLEMLSSLSNLKNLSLLALTTFTAAEILAFLGKLDAERQKGFSFSLMAQVSDHQIQDYEEENIRADIEQRLGGRFEFAYWREADSSDSDDD